MMHVSAGMRAEGAVMTQAYGECHHDAVKGTTTLCFLARWPCGQMANYHGPAVIEACFRQLPFETDATETQLHAPRR